MMFVAAEKALACYFTLEMEKAVELGVNLLASHVPLVDSSQEQKKGGKVSRMESSNFFPFLLPSTKIWVRGMGCKFFEMGMKLTLLAVGENAIKLT